MKRLLPLFALTVSLALPLLTGAQTGPAHAQPSQPSGDASTAPHNRGATGWTGGAREQDTPTTTGSSSASSPQGTPPSAANSPNDPSNGQPLMATGEDLNGTPKRFAPNKTPE